MLDVSVSGLLPLSVNLTKFTHPKVKRDSLCLDRLWLMLISSVSFKPMKSRNVISKRSPDHNDNAYNMVHIGCFPKSTKKKVFQLKPDSDRVLSPDSEYMTQSGQIGR